MPVNPYQQRPAPWGSNTNPPGNVPPGQTPMGGSTQQPYNPTQTGTPYTPLPGMGPGGETGGMRGSPNGQPTPWWQLNPGGAQNQVNSAPPGYTFDLNQRRYVPIGQSAPYQQELEQRRRQREDTLNQQEDIEFQKRQAYNDQTLKNRQQGFNALQGLYNSPGGGGWGGGPGNFTSPTVNTPPQTTFNPGAGGGGGLNVLGAANAAQNAAFGRAKATAGSLGQSAMEGLRANLADRGILGSGVEARGLVDRLAAATNPLSDLNTAGLHENVGILQHNQDLANQGAITAYQGGITQRGQDITSNQENAQRSFEAWKLQQELQQQQRLAALQGINRLY